MKREVMRIRDDGVIKTCSKVSTFDTSLSPAPTLYLYSIVIDAGVCILDRTSSLFQRLHVVIVVLECLSRLGMLLKQWAILLKNWGMRIQRTKQSLSSRIFCIVNATFKKHASSTSPHYQFMSPRTLIAAEREVFMYRCCIDNACNTYVLVPTLRKKNRATIYCAYIRLCLSVPATVLFLVLVWR